MRYAYGRGTRRILRTCMFVGTANPDSENVLPDDPNGRRVIAVKVNPPEWAYGSKMKEAMAEICEDVMAAAVLVVGDNRHIIVPPHLTQSCKSRT